MALLDIKGFAAISRNLSSKNLFDFLNAYFEMIGRLIQESGGEVIKFIGDAALVIFPSDSPRKVVGNLRNIQQRAQEHLERAGYENAVQVKGHIGKVYLGDLGTHDRKCLDIIGAAVNDLFLLPTEDDFVLSKDLEQQTQE